MGLFSSVFMGTGTWIEMIGETGKIVSVLKKL